MMNKPNEPRPLFELLAEFEAERLAEIERENATPTPQWLIDRRAAKVKRDIERGIRDAEGNYILPDDDDDDDDDD